MYTFVYLLFDVVDVCRSPTSQSRPKVHCKISSSYKSGLIFKITDSCQKKFPVMVSLQIYYFMHTVSMVSGAAIIKPDNKK